jgi:hypothetical protein
MTRDKRLHGIEAAGAGSVGAVADGQIIGPCPSCGAELRIGMAQNPVTTFIERALMHPVPFCTYFGETAPEAIERDIKRHASS